MAESYARQRASTNEWPYTGAHAANKFCFGAARACRLGRCRRAVALPRETSSCKVNVIYKRARTFLTART